jgi:excisionase family DNA binding protein
MTQNEIGDFLRYAAGIKPVLPEGRRALRFNDAAKAYGVSRATLYELAKKGELKIYKLGGRSLLRVEDLEALLARGAA